MKKALKMEKAIAAEAENSGQTAASVSTSRMALSAMFTENTADASKFTTTHSEPGIPGGFLGVHVALIFVAFLVALPSPIAALWGGGQSGSPWFAVITTLGWVVVTTLLNSFSCRDTLNAKNQERLAAGLLVTDVAGLTLLLQGSGAAQNPFTMLYFVPITQATFVARAWTFRIALLSVAGFLLLLATTAEALKPHLVHPQHSHFFDHVKGMAVALAVAGVFITVFVRQMARQLKTQREAIARLSAQRAEDRVAIALGALAAGAGHELGSPLGTIQLVAEELPHLSEVDRVDARDTIVEQVQRMKRIVHSMSTTELSADSLRNVTAWSPSGLFAENGELLTTNIVLADEQTTQPRSIVGQISRELVRNARQADPDTEVRVRIAARAGSLSIVVEDDGPGLPPEALLHAMDPFVSHRGSTGLGLFLAKVHAQQLGGTLRLESTLGEGTRAILELPLHPSLQEMR